MSSPFKRSARPAAMAPIALAALLAALPAAAQTALPPAPAPALAVAPPSARALPGPIRPAPTLVQSSPCDRVDVAPLVQIPVGKSTVIRPNAPIARILLGNPENARAASPASTPDARKDEGVKAPTVNLRPGVADVDVLLLGPGEVYLLGKTIGSTNVVMIDRSNICTAFDVVVGMDVTGLQSVLGQLLPDEKGIRVSAAFDSVVLAGTVSDAEALTRVMDLAKAYVRGQDGGASGSGAGNPRIVNMLALGSPQQVMLEVKVAEVSKALLDKFGINFTRALISGDGTARILNGLFGGVGLLGSQVGGVEPGGRIEGTIAGSVGGNGQAVSTFSGPVVRTPRGIESALGASTTTVGVDAQKTDGLVKVLAEPTVMAVSGQRGSFVAGGKLFIPVAQETNGAGRSVTLEEKDFGVKVAFLPTVVGGGRINLEVATEVSELNREGVGISAPGVGGLAVLPSFTSRKAQTTVQLMDGQSFAIGGLIRNNTTTNIKAFPVLGELPVIGALFRSSQFQTDRSELVFVITPRLVKPLPSDYKLPTDNYVPPTRQELHFEGRLEGRKPAPSDAPRSASTPATPGGGLDLATTQERTR